MNLYDCQMAPNPRRARIFIAEKGLDIPKQEVNIMKGENLGEDYLRVNPWGIGKKVLRCSLLEPVPVLYSRLGHKLRSVDFSQIRRSDF